jgi:hypothetical protein
VRTATNHFSLAFTYDCIAWTREPRPGEQYSAVGTGKPFMDIYTLTF